MAEITAVPGRGPYARTVEVTTTATSTALTAAAGTFQEEDTGRSISGSGIPADATLVSIESDTAATLSVAATAGATVPATIDAGDPAVYGFVGWSPESDAESETYSIAGGASADAPGNITTTGTPITRRTRS